MILLDVDRSHVLEDTGPQTLAPVGHGAVLEGSGEHQHVSGLAAHLDGVLVEVIRVIGVAGQSVRVGAEGSAAVVRVELGEEGDELEGERRSRVEDVRVGGGQLHPVVGVVEVRQLATVAGQHRVSSQAGDRAPLPQHYVADVHHNRMQSQLLKDLALVEKCPNHAVEVVMLFIS